MIRSDDRLEDALERDDRVLDALADASPHLIGIRNPLTRKALGPHATVDQVARLAGVEPDLLVHRVNRALKRSDRGRRKAGEAAAGDRSIDEGRDTR